MRRLGPFKHRNALSSALTLSLLSLSFSTPSAAQMVRSAEPKISERSLNLNQLKLAPQMLKARLPSQQAPEFLLELTRAPKNHADFSQVESSLNQAGLSVVYAGSKPLYYKQFVVVKGGNQALLQGAGLGLVRKIHPPIPPGLRPLDRSREIMGMNSAQGANPARGRLTGKGVVLADVDSAADIFHPDFFHADGGWYDWIDVNGNGIFDPEIDAVDLNGDGQASADELGVVLRASPRTMSSGEEVSGVRSAGFDPRVDWVYLDLNGDKARNHGAANGFNDDTPAFGEPLFAPDDVNQDGRITPEERLVRLGTSKFTKYYVNVDYEGQRFDHVFQRGADLSSAPSDFTGGAHGYSDTLHATGVLSIAAGGVALPSRRWVGIAPEADLVLAFHIGNSMTAPVVWALNEAPDILLHEASVWTHVAMDGTDPWSQLIDESAGDGVLNVCPAGNIGGTRKHAKIELAAGASGELSFDIPSSIDAAFISLHVRGGHQLGLNLKEPDGTLHAMNQHRSLNGGGTLYYYGSEITPRGTQVLDFVVYQSPGGPFSIEVSGNPAQASTIHGYLADQGGFALSTAWDAAIATDRYTAAVPSTATECLGVGAIGAHLAGDSDWAGNDPEQFGEVRGYSGRGPRIDGHQAIDIVAPDNPWASSPEGDLFPNMPGIVLLPHGSMSMFSGTSGAGPHVAGLGALLIQAGQKGEAAMNAIRQGAAIDPIAGSLPNTDYGFGRLSAAGAFGQAEKGEAPVLELQVEPSRADRGEVIRVVPVATDATTPSSELRIRWDEGYDGDWDTELLPVEAREFTQQSSPLRVKAQVWDADGWIAEAAIHVPFISENGAGGSSGAGGSGGVAGSAGAGQGDAIGRLAGGGGCTIRTIPQGNKFLGISLLVAGAGLVAARKRRKYSSA